MRDGTLALAVETSCDETAVAILRGRDRLLASEVASQVSLHQAFGGVVPEVASRNHLVKIKPLIGAALKQAGEPISDLDCIAATRGPGLLTSLLVGYSVAKGLAIGLRKPFIGVNHLEGHLLSPFFGEPGGPKRSVGLVASGGHTMLIRLEDVGVYRVLGQTLDDAAGEAFDKVAKLMRLPYPGGPAIDELARSGDPLRFDLPRPPRLFDRANAGLTLNLQNPVIAAVGDENRAAGMDVDPVWLVELNLVRRSTDTRVAAVSRAGKAGNRSNVR